MTPTKVGILMTSTLEFRRRYSKTTQSATHPNVPKELQLAQLGHVLQVCSDQLCGCLPKVEVAH